MKSSTAFGDGSRFPYGRPAVPYDFNRILTRHMQRVDQPWGEIYRRSGMFSEKMKGETTTGGGGGGGGGGGDGQHHHGYGRPRGLSGLDGTATPERRARKARQLEYRAELDAQLRYSRSFVSPIGGGKEKVTGSAAPALARTMMRPSQVPPGVLWLPWDQRQVEDEHLRMRDWQQFGERHEIRNQMNRFGSRSDRSRHPKSKQRQYNILTGAEVVEVRPRRKTAPPPNLRLTPKPEAWRAPQLASPLAASGRKVMHGISDKIAGQLSNALTVASKANAGWLHPETARQVCRLYFIPTDKVKQAIDHLLGVASNRDGLIKQEAFVNYLRAGGNSPSIQGFRAPADVVPLPLSPMMAYATRRRKKEKPDWGDLDIELDAARRSRRSAPNLQAAPLVDMLSDFDLEIPKHLRMAKEIRRPRPFRRARPGRQHKKNAKQAQQEDDFSFAKLVKSHEELPSLSRVLAEGSAGQGTPYTGISFSAAGDMHRSVPDSTYLDWPEPLTRA
eukprot:g1258.t1